jgi:hypothetical protein
MNRGCTFGNRGTINRYLPFARPVILIETQVGDYAMSLQLFPNKRLCVFWYMESK